MCGEIYIHYGGILVTTQCHILFTPGLIFFFFMQKENRDLIQDCWIGVADVSDHSAIYLKIHLNCRRKDTLWRLNVGILNNKSVVEQIRADIRTYLEENNNGETDSAILWDALKAVIRGKLIAITSNLKR